MAAAIRVGDERAANGIHTLLKFVSLFLGLKQSGLQVQGQGATPGLHFQSG